MSLSASCQLYQNNKESTLNIKSPFISLELSSLQCLKHDCLKLNLQISTDEALEEIVFS